MTESEATALVQLVATHKTLQGKIKDRGHGVFQFTLTGALKISEPFLVYTEGVRRLRESGVKVPRTTFRRNRQLNQRQAQLRALR